MVCNILSKSALRIAKQPSIRNGSGQSKMIISENLLKKVINGDESGVYSYSSEIKQHLHSGSFRVLTKKKNRQSNIKSVLIVFFFRL